MRKLAFGSQDVDYTRDEYKTANENIHREKDIELWAKDVYDFMCRKFGKENIVGFDCHLDENAPHLHVAIVPVGPGNKVSYSGVFGDKRYKQSEFMRKFHTDLANEVSNKYGMERGEDTTGRDVHHRDKSEYYAQLSRDIRTAEIRLNSLQTMVDNLEAKISETQEELNSVQAEIATGKGDKAELEAKAAELQKKVDDLEAKLQDKREKLLEANNAFAELKEKEQGTVVKKENTEQELQNIKKELFSDYGALADAAMFNAIYPQIKELFANDEKFAEFLGDKSVLSGLDHDDVNEIRREAIITFFTIISGGTPVSVGTGGGGTSSDLKWRDDDPNESHAALMRRCMTAAIQSRKMAKAPKRKR